MPIITFWSNNKKAIGQTVAASATATAMAIERNYKTILISVDFENSVMEECFGSQQSNAELIKNLISTPKINIGTGINGLLKIAQSNRLTPEMIKDYTKIVYKNNRLEVLYSSTNMELTEEERFECLKRIILNANQYYDYVILDLQKSIKEKVYEILDMSDVIVLNTEQGTKTLEDFYNIKEMQKFISSNKILWNICRYDKNSKYNVKNLTRTIWKKQTIYTVPYNTLLFEASKEGTIAELLLKIRTIKAQDENTELFEELKKLIDGILTRYHEVRMKIR